jgi:xanthine dehydrogenase YagT iron-sulfur-binding subunit
MVRLPPTGGWFHEASPNSFGQREIYRQKALSICMTKGKKRSKSLDEEGETPWNRSITRRDFVKTGIAAGGVAGAVVVAGKGSLQALQVGTPPITATPTDPFAARLITLNVNGSSLQVQVEPRSLLIDVLRDKMGLVAAKKACNRMTCGACTVLIDGQPFEACGYLAVRAVNHAIVTPEIATKDPVVDALQKAAPIGDMAQCGYCCPGIIMAVTPLLRQNTNPSVADVKAALSGNICRCGNYMHIIDTVMLAAKTLRGGS